MKIQGAILSASIIIGLLLLAGEGCIRTCDEPDPFDSGDYLIVEPAYIPIVPGDEWLLGGQLHVDRDARVATIRYTSEGTTYEVRYTLED